ncbi:MAG TPA: hypothetical protein VK850_19080 [Candidatus Binatia bacterium]|nr:hypothetical protein [Candidatus Binatia bacterium]
MIAVLCRFVLLAGLLDVSTGAMDLQQHLVSPSVPGESNFYLDLWQPPKIGIIATGSGLTNNHALFINSHGKGVKTKGGARFVFYPHADIGQGEFSIEDIAAAVGPENVPKIHNLVIGACNTDSTFDVAEVRKYFPNATNIIHSARGQAGYQEMLFQLLLADSSQIETLYQTRAPDGDFDFTNHPVPDSTKMSPYIATLFLPGKQKPYRTQKAGRELLTKVPLSDVVPVTMLE